MVGFIVIVLLALTVVVAIFAGRRAVKRAEAGRRPYRASAYTPLGGSSSNTDSSWYAYTIASSVDTYSYDSSTFDCYSGGDSGGGGDCGGGGD